MSVAAAVNVLAIDAEFITGDGRTIASGASQHVWRSGLCAGIAAHQSNPGGLLAALLSTLDPIVVTITNGPHHLSVAYSTSTRRPKGGTQDSRGNPQGTMRCHLGRPAIGLGLRESLRCAWLAQLSTVRIVCPPRTNTCSTAHGTELPRVRLPPALSDGWMQRAARSCGIYSSRSFCAGTRSKFNNPFAVLFHIANGDSVPDIPATIR